VRLAAALGVGVTALALAACGSGGSGSGASAGSLPKVDDFAAGPCRAMAPGLIDVLRTARQDPAAAEPRALSAALTPPQKTLHGLQPTAGQFGPALENVTTTIGFVRLRADSRNYDPALLVDVKRATESLVGRCTTGN
jgi:hypothetical protein